jgi:predicted transcriptional regulator
VSEHQRLEPPWLAGLMEQVEENLERRTAGRHDQRPALEQELKEINESIQGWSISLAKPQLPDELREAIETQWTAAVERQRGINAELDELTQERLRADQLVRPDQVLVRLGRLADVLATNDPTRGNLELALHIDRISCCRDGRVTSRMCKLGVMPEVVELVSTPAVGGQGDGAKESTPSRSRRRSKLRVVEDDEGVDLNTQAHFVANPNRFAGLGDEWFWEDELRIPESSCWASDNAEAVFQRRQESRLPYSKLAEEFEVTPSTIGAAIRHYLKTHPGERDEVDLKHGGKRRPTFDLAKFAQEARDLWVEGWSKERLAKKYGCSAPTVSKAIAFAYAQGGLPMPTREEARRARTMEARRLHDEGNSLLKIARAMKTSDVTVRQYLRESFAAEGNQMPDLRRRKGV